MAEETENDQKPNDAEIRNELLKKSAALKEKGALLKAQMDATAKACDELLSKDKSDTPTSAEL